MVWRTSVISHSCMQGACSLLPPGSAIRWLCFLSKLYSVNIITFFLRNIYVSSSRGDPVVKTRGGCCFRAAVLLAISFLCSCRSSLVPLPGVPGVIRPFRGSWGGTARLCSPGRVGRGRLTRGQRPALRASGPLLQVAPSAAAGRALHLWRVVAFQLQGEH